MRCTDQLESNYVLCAFSWPLGIREHFFSLYHITSNTNKYNNTHVETFDNTFQRNISFISLRKRRKTFLFKANA